MKVYVPILITAFVLGIAALIWYTSIHHATSSQGEYATTTPITFPTVNGVGTSTSTVSAIMTIALNGGGTITTKDFLHNSVTIPDPSNAGTFYLAGSPGYCDTDGTCPSAAPAKNFTITYDSKNQFFTVALNEEPLGGARHDAESFLENALGIPLKDMCRLKYYIGTQNAVNETYAGKNLGFSICAGAIALP